MHPALGLYPCLCSFRHMVQFPQSNPWLPGGWAPSITNRRRIPHCLYWLSWKSKVTPCFSRPDNPAVPLLLYWSQQDARMKSTPRGIAANSRIMSNSERRPCFSALISTTLIPPSWSLSSYKNTDENNAGSSTTLIRLNKTTARHLCGFSCGCYFYFFSLTMSKLWRQ